ncbi:MAG: NAD(P)-dependent oxidoreductase, partial [Octadecabacter sp.]
MKVGFVGLGSVGGKLAGSVLRNGFDLSVFDLDADAVAGFVARGAKNGGSPAALMAECDVVITCLPSPAACAAVVEQMLPSVAAGKIWLEMSTTDAAQIQAHAKAVRDRGGFAVDCPVSGGCHRADTGNISIFAG